MGTRAVVNFVDSENNELARLYRQFDGYPSQNGLGHDIYNALNNGNFKIVNGFGFGASIPEVFNGFSCLVPYLIGKLKVKIGGVYMMPVGDSDYGEEYQYTLYEKDETVFLKILDIYENSVLFDDLIKNYDYTKF